MICDWNNYSTQLTGAVTERPENPKAAKISQPLEQRLGEADLRKKSNGARQASDLPLRIGERLSAQLFCSKKFSKPHLPSEKIATSINPQQTPALRRNHALVPRRIPNDFHAGILNTWQH